MSTMRLRSRDVRALVSIGGSIVAFAIVLLMGFGTTVASAGAIDAGVVLSWATRPGSTGFERDLRDSGRYLVVAAVVLIAALGDDEGRRSPGSSVTSRQETTFGRSSSSPCMRW